MKTTGQIGLALVAIIALVAGVTYLSQYGPGAGRGNADAATPAKDEKVPGPPDAIVFATTKVEWSEANEGDFEKDSRGHHDFFFQSFSDKPYLLGIDRKNCKCEDAEVMVLEEGQLRGFHNWFGTGAATVLAGLQRGPLACVSLMAWEELEVPKLFGLNIKWEGLDQETKKGVLVPPKGGGLLRVLFKGKKDLLGAFRVQVRLWSEPEGKPSLRGYLDLELPIKYVAPIVLSAGQVNLEGFNAKDEKGGAIVIYSTTRASFHLYVTEVHPSPLVNLQIEDLNPEEIAEYQMATAADKRILSAKRIKIAVHERLSDSQRMDLGPFYRKFFVSTTQDDPEEAQFIVGGEIHGELVVGAPEDRGRIDLKSFKARAGVSKTVTVLAQQPDLELDTKDIRIFPENLQAQMHARLEKVKPAGGEQRNRWHLHVILSPSFPAGKMPEGSAVFLQIKGSNPPRQIRIPMTGMAYQ